MIAPIAVAVIASLAFPATAGTHERNWTRHADSTSYCLRGTMADGTNTRSRSVAMNSLPLGSKIKVRRPFQGKQVFIVRDRIGHGTQLDFWSPSCAASIRYGRRTVHYKILRRGR